MIRQLLKVIWNRKRSNVLLMVELFASCMAIFVISSILTGMLADFWAPLGFSYKDLIFVNCYWSKPLGQEKVNTKMIQERYRIVKNEIEQFNEVESSSIVTSAVPYLFNTSKGFMDYKSHRINPFMHYCDDNFFNAAKLNLVEGRWFNSNDDAIKIKPAVINQEFKERVFGSESALGKIVQDYKAEYRVVGVVTDYRFRGETYNKADCIFFRYTLGDIKQNIAGHILIRLKPNSSIMAEDKIIKKISGLYPDANVTLERIEDMRERVLRPVKLSWILLATISLFLLINVGLGLYGILWTNISRRRPEIGVRRALGADTKMIYMQILGEVLILTTLSVAVGVIVELQFSIFNFFELKYLFYVIGIILSGALIYIVACMCAAYPSYLASKIEPADALHDE